MTRNEMFVELFKSILSDSRIAIENSENRGKLGINGCYYCDFASSKAHEIVKDYWVDPKLPTPTKEET